jgi:hypothetical protein
MAIHLAPILIQAAVGAAVKHAARKAAVKRQEEKAAVADRRR